MCVLSFTIATTSAYPVGNLAAEVIVIIVLGVLDVIRIYFGELQVIDFVCS